MLRPNLDFFEHSLCKVGNEVAVRRPKWVACFFGSRNRFGGCSIKVANPQRPFACGICRGVSKVFSVGRYSKTLQRFVGWDRELDDLPFRLATAPISKLQCDGDQNEDTRGDPRLRNQGSR